VRFLPILLLAVLLTGCATRRLPKYQKPLKRTPVQYVRTTAYNNCESDHVRYGCRSAIGTPLRYDTVHSAAADWSRWPEGTVFQIEETGEVCQVDDYGWALAGTNTIDLYKPTMADMRLWAVRRVHIHILHWGDPWHSYRLLKPVRRYAHVKRMMWEIRKFY